MRVVGSTSAYEVLDHDMPSRVVGEQEKSALPFPERIYENHVADS